MPILDSLHAGCPPVALNVGFDLASARRSKGITLDQISNITKIGKHYLEAIENGEFEKLPGGIFTINYLRQYALAIDAGDADLLAYCDSRAAARSR